MVICVIALAVFGFLGIFSAKYRALAREAFSCVFRRMTLRKCETGFDRRMRMRVVAGLMRRSPRAARAVNRRFEAISWALALTMFVSFALSASAVYNLVVYGSCDPQSMVCVFSPQGLSCGSQHCQQYGCTCGGLEANCTPENSYAACNGSCDCNKRVCGGSPAGTGIK